jgi:hypothetical protein
VTEKIYWPLNWPFGLGTVGVGDDVPDTYQPQVFAKLPGDLAGTIVGERYGPVLHWDIRHSPTHMCNKKDTIGVSLYKTNSS